MASREDSTSNRFTGIDVLGATTADSWVESVLPTLGASLRLRLAAQQWRILLSYVSLGWLRCCYHHAARA